MNFRLNKKASNAIKIIISVGALAFVFIKIDMSEVIAIFGQSNPALVIAAIIVFVLSKTIAAFRLNFFLRKTGVLISELSNLKLYLVGMFYNLFLPGGIGGDGYKIYLLSKNKNVSGKRVFWAVLCDRLNGVLALFSLAVFLSLFLEVKTQFNFKALIWILIPLAFTIAYFLLKKFLSYFADIFVRTSILSFGVQILQTLCAYIIFLAIGARGNEIDYLLVFLISSIVAMLPISIGGVGTRELTFLYGSQLLGLDPNISIALSLMFYLITAFVSFWGIFYSVNNISRGI